MRLTPAYRSDVHPDSISMHTKHKRRKLPSPLPFVCISDALVPDILSLLFDEADSVCRYSLFTPHKSQSLSGCSLDGNGIFLYPYYLRQHFLHSGNVRIQLRVLSTHRSVDVPHAISFSCYQLNGTGQQDAAIDIFVIIACVGKVEADVAHAGSSEQRVADSVYQNIRIAVPQQSLLEGNIYTTYTKAPAFNQTMHVISETYTKRHSSLFICARTFPLCHPYQTIA